jgi:hypothetical protein
MSTDYPANGAQSASQCKENPNGRWAALRNSLIDPNNGVVTMLQNQVEFGVVVFGTQNMCPIPGTPVQPALNNLQTVIANVPTVQPGMYTPTGPALDWVYDNMIQDVAPDQENGPQLVILATDGEPNSCGGGNGGRNNGGGNNNNGTATNYQPSIDAVNKGTAKGVTTYIISLADASGDFHTHLQELANLGNPGANGNAMLYEPGSPQELADALAQLIGGAVGCDIALSGTIASGSECEGTVMLNGTTLGCNQADGWKLIDDNHIRLQGQACKDLMAKNGQVQARFPCDVFSPE